VDHDNKPANLDDIPSLARGRRHLPDRVQLKPFPKVALQVLEMAASPEVTALDLVDIVELDPVITSKVLRVSNSVMFGGQREIATLEQASVRLGTSKIVELVTLASAGSYFRSSGDACPEAVQFLWKRSLGTACAARTLAAERGLEQQVAYTVGLLQNLGHLVLLQYYGNEIGEVSALVDAGATPWEAELERFGYNHAQLSAELMEEWQFPAEVVRLVGGHHSGPSPEEPALLAVARAAESLSTEILSESKLLHPSVAWMIQDVAQPDLDSRPEGALERIKLEIETLTSAVTCG